MLGNQMMLCPLKQVSNISSNSAVIGQHEDGTTFPNGLLQVPGRQEVTSGLLSRAGYNASNLSWNRMYGEPQYGY